MYACPSYLLCYLNVVRNRRILSLIVFCRAHPRLKIGCLCRTGNGLASRAKRALFAACQPANPVGFTLGKQGGLEPLCACWGNLSPSPFERFLQNRLCSCGAFFACAYMGLLYRNAFRGCSVFSFMQSTQLVFTE